MASEKPECPKCGSKEIRTRRTDGKSYCRVCGNEWTNETLKESMKEPEKPK